LFRSWRRSGASFGQRRPICVDQVYRAPGRSGHRALRRQRRRLLRQRSRRDDQRPVQDRSDPSTRAMALVRGRRVRDAGMGRLVQQSPAAGAHRQHPAGRSRGTLLRYARRAGHGSVTQTKMPPANPARFRALGGQALEPGCAWADARSRSDTLRREVAMTRSSVSPYRARMIGTRHMAAAGHYLAAQVALQVLEAGGNAVDAGVAGGITLGVVQSEYVCFGGVAPLMIYWAETDEVISISGLGTWPAL